MPTTFNHQPVAATRAKLNEHDGAFVENNSSRERMLDQLAELYARPIKS